MVNYVNKNATFECDHSGIGTIATATSKYTVDSNDPLLNKTEALTMVIAGCTNVPPPPSNVPCTAIVSITGESIKLTKDNIGIILDNCVFVTNSVPPGGITISGNQTKWTEGSA